LRLLDTDVCVDVFRGYPPALAWLATLTDQPGIPGHVVMELIEGCRNTREVRVVMRRLAPFRFYWPTEADQVRALQTYTRAHLSHRLGLIDALIGKCAVGLSATLCTFYVRHFRAMAHLLTEQPSSR
jgi:predicted nucleic acid-binding protein